MAPGPREHSDGEAGTRRECSVSAVQRPPTGWRDDLRVCGRFWPL